MANCPPGYVPWDPDDQNTPATDDPRRDAGINDPPEGAPEESPQPDTASAGEGLEIGDAVDGATEGSAAEDRQSVDQHGKTVLLNTARRLLKVLSFNHL